MIVDQDAKVNTENLTEEEKRQYASFVDPDGTESWEYTADIQNHIVALLLYSAEFSKKSVKLLEPWYFTDGRNQLIARLVISLTAKYGCYPGHAAIITEYKDVYKGKKTDVILWYAEQLGILQSAYASGSIIDGNTDYWLDKVLRFRKIQELKSCFNKVRESYVNKPDVSPDFNKLKSYIDEAKSKTSSSDIQIQSWDELEIESDSQIEDWWWQGWGEFGCLHLLTGLPFGGKSSFVAELLGAMVRGEDFCGLKLQQVPCLLLDFENKSRILHKRLKRAVGDCPNTARFFNRIKPDSIPRPLTTEWVSYAVQKVRESTHNQKMVVIIDTFRSAMSGADELDPGEIYKLLVPFKLLAEELNLCIIVLHHNAKASNAYSGSTAFAGVADYLWNCQKDAEHLRTTLKWEGRDDVTPDLVFQYCMEDKRLHYIGTQQEAKMMESEEADDLRMYRVLKWFSETEYRLASAVEDTTITDKQRRSWLVMSKMHGLIDCQQASQVKIVAPNRSLAYKLTTEGLNFIVEQSPKLSAHLLLGYD